MALSSIASKSLKKWFTNKNTLRQISLPLFRHLKSKSSSQSDQITLFANNSWPRKSIISPSKEDELRQVFRFFDENKDGKISVDELRSYFVSVGDSMSREEAAKVINEFDKDGDSLLEFGEFVELIEQDEEQGDHVKKAFEMFVEVDKGSSSSSSSSSGCITPRGLQQVLKRLGNVKSFDECKAMIGVYDLDGNGVLDFNEFQRMMS
ncbi:OLC1v1017853C1 [Oldenlandia corymbosa var. corymbosa]|uniref:OLC1v1017853C1 n=1 Tax=Oldenlandia corymbosa var. corymbosa TaxID=529605 RepID=A0AAV1EAE1_OLDCO|nr:OLC1v1017853C1 [Oldenlandia corymbosa var. corymbosa]